ncbi:hypothetical protein YTPLAS18_12360 [Nitrospira sp.]|nr:hypothetical protein YTPLAS18_12360 [Nitrospira sp.]
MMRMALLAGVLLVLTGDPAWSGTVAEAAVSATHRVTGKVIARVTQERPNTIVLSTGTGPAEVIVGATVGEDVSIRRGKKAVRLEQIRLGETIQLTYVKTSSGLVAVSIVAE